MIITLIGYRGSGKSTVARPLAERLGWQWVDADTEIENQAGCTIREIFEQQGESGFRKIERDVIAELLSRDNLVLAAGGGAILNADTRDQMRHAGPVVWLKASPEILAKRIERDDRSAAGRPDLTKTGGHGEIVELLRQRTPLYAECATFEIDTDQFAADELVDEIYQHCAEQAGGGN